MSCRFRTILDELKDLQTQDLRKKIAACLFLPYSTDQNSNSLDLHDLLL